MDIQKLRESGVKLCIPGMRLSAANHEFIAGSGTHEFNGYIYSTLAGVLKMIEDDQTKVGIKSSQLPVIHYCLILPIRHIKCCKTITHK